jgi:methyl-accepting chemotaxis protein
MRAPPKPKSRFLKLLRRTATTAQKGAARGASDENALWLAHERASSAVRVVIEATQRVGAQLAKQRGAADHAVDQAKGLTSRMQEVERAAARTVDVLERLSVVALNASLEAVRMGEGPGRPLALVSDEVRSHAERGADGARLLIQATRDLAAEIGVLSGRVDDTRQPGLEIATETSRAQAAAGDVERALVDMHERLRTATGSDPETLRAMSDASEHAKALVSALGKLSGRVPRALLVGALTPLFEPLLRVVDEGKDTEEETE